MFSSSPKSRLDSRSGWVDSCKLLQVMPSRLTDRPLFPPHKAETALHSNKRLQAFRCTAMLMREANPTLSRTSSIRPWWPAIGLQIRRSPHDWLIVSFPRPHHHTPPFAPLPTIGRWSCSCPGAEEPTCSKFSRGIVWLAIGHRRRRMKRSACIGC